MMDVTFIYHSCYVVETQKAIFVFDYFKSPNGDMLSRIQKRKPVYVFVSHSHSDHFSREILNWRNEVPGIRYIVSSDVKIYGGDVLKVEPDKTYELDNLIIKTLPSTDEGVAFSIDAGKEQLYHAGDLHWWYWEDRGPEYVEYWGDVFKEQMDKIRGNRYDVAFMLLDPRMQNGYGAGMKEFMDAVDCNHVFPLHMWDDYAIVDRFKGDSAYSDYAKRLMAVKAPGDKFSI